MSIHVKFFASLRERVGLADAEIEHQASLTPALVWQQLVADLPLETNVLIAVNLEYVAADYLLNEGDELAFFPPVTGG